MTESGDSENFQPDGHKYVCTNPKCGLSWVWTKVTSLRPDYCPECGSASMLDQMSTALHRDGRPTPEEWLELMPAKGNPFLIAKYRTKE